MSEVAIGGPDDTLIVQTFTYGWPVNPGWNSPREGKFFFPTAERRFEKILMYYTLKCDPSQNPPCGEWDYLTYTRLYEHTGIMDSTQLTHPNFTVFGATPDTLAYMLQPSFSWYARSQNHARVVSAARLDSTILGNGTEAASDPFSTSFGDARSYVLWTRTELEAAGLSSDTLTAMRFRVLGNGGDVARLTVRVKRFTGNEWQVDLPLQRNGYITVFDASLTLPDDDWVTVQFTQPFIIWGGGLLAEFSLVSDNTVLVAGDSLHDAGFTYSATSDDYYLEFQHRGHVHCGNISELNSAKSFTLEAWFKPDVLRDWSNLIIRSRNNEHRVGIQLGPVSDDRVDVYCLVGNGENSYGRTNNRPVFTGQWHHVAMVYDGNAEPQAERLKLYINGIQQVLRWNGEIPSETASIEAPLSISGPGANSMKGAIDEVRVWRSALSGENIRMRMHEQIRPDDVLFGDLISAWDFNDGSGSVAHDVTGRYHGTLAFPKWRRFDGDRPRGFAASAVRPAVVLERGVITTELTESIVVDKIENPPLMVILYGDTMRANIPTDTLIVWPVGYDYSLDPDGNITDSIAQSADGVLTMQRHYYYTPPFERLNRYELGRYITPYGIGLDLGEGWTWIWDVTDFAPLLKDTVHLTAGNFQELLDMKFIFIEGIPARDVLSVENVWQGDFALKHFAEQVAPKTINLDPTAAMFKLRTTATGHQFSNPTNCAEFCPKIHSVDVNGQTRWSWQIIQECSMNPLYPQGGTWIYARSGWCPGMEATTKEFELTPYVVNSRIEIDYNSQYDEYGNYVFESQLVSYTAPNHRMDAAIEAIIAPNSYELHGRFNPACDRPRIVIKNCGEQEMTSVDITYGPRGGNTNTWTWNGNLDFLEKSEIRLPAFDWGEWNGDNVFEVTLSNPNGGRDEYYRNNSLSSHFETVPVHDSPIVIVFRTNNAPHENSYEVKDADGNVVLRRIGFSANTTYYDTLKLLPGCYEFILHDSGEDGIAWWANNDGIGFLRILQVGSQFSRTMQPDFGKQSRYAFRYSNLLSVTPPTLGAEHVHIYPNPVSELVTLRVEMPGVSQLRYQVCDIVGRVLSDGDVLTTAEGVYKASVDVSSLHSGAYVVNIVEGAKILYRSQLTVLR